jgi:soluble lytic murein transglycosylase-like protein
MSTAVVQRILLRRPILFSGAALLLTALAVFSFPSTTRPDFDGRSPRYTKQALLRAIHWHAYRYRIEPALLWAVIKAESEFNPEAVSRKGAVGLMQLMPSVAAQHRITDPYDPIQNIRAGAKQLRHLLDLYDGDLELTIAAYNAGAKRIKQQRVPKFRETRRYVKKVLRYYEEFQANERRNRVKWRSDPQQPAEILIKSRPASERS